MASRSIVWKGSPNFGYPRGTQGQVRRLWAKVFHITGGGSLPGMDSWFGNPDAFASAQYGLDGRAIHQYVRDNSAAWHAGVLNAPDMSNAIIRKFVNERRNPNVHTIGIEVVADVGDVLGRDSWDNLVWLSADIDSRHPQLGDTMESHLGHFQIDSINRARDPETVYLVKDAWEDHHDMAHDLTPGQKKNQVTAVLLPNVVDIEALLTRASLYDSRMLMPLKDGKFQELADAVAANQRALAADLAGIKKVSDRLLAQLRFLGVTPN